MAERVPLRVIREEQESNMTTKTIEGDLNAGGAKFGLAVSRFNSLITERLPEGAMDCLRRNGASKKTSKLCVFLVLEMPVTLQWMAEKRRFDQPGRIRGGTPFDYVAAEVTKGQRQCHANRHANYAGCSYD